MPEEQVPDGIEQEDSEAHKEIETRRLAMIADLKRRSKLLEEEQISK